MILDIHVYSINKLPFFKLMVGNSSLPLQCPMSHLKKIRNVNISRKFSHHLINSFRKILALSHKHHLKSLMLQIAKGLLDAEAIEAVEDTFFYMDENCAAFDMPGSLAELQELCKTIHHQIDKVDEERYDLAGKGGKCDKEIEDLRIKVIEFQGLSADSMLQALLGSKHKVSMDFRANLKEVKKEVKEEVTMVDRGRTMIPSTSLLFKLPVCYSNSISTHTCVNERITDMMSAGPFVAGLLGSFAWTKMQLVTGVRTLMTRQAWMAERRRLRPHNICGATQSHFTCLSLCPNNKSVVVSHGCILYLDVRYIK
ncbi:uncharacterized protein LOC115144810 isoform X1 [Oncorhynchus nerka]|uniref:uncharacterized protein LOC115144810 isoform X1 n=1 Tax=Oncorhynchus nerka TaxID=8023 RepID=UPI0031B855E2